MERKRILRSVVPVGSAVLYTDHVEGSGTDPIGQRVTTISKASWRSEKMVYTRRKKQPG